MVASVGDDLDAGALHPATRLVVPLERERPSRTEREHVGAHRLELLVGHLDDLDPPLGEQLHQPHRREPGIDDGEIAVERRDQRHQVHHLGGADPVRQVEARSPRRRGTTRGAPRSRPHRCGSRGRRAACRDRARPCRRPRRLPARPSARRSGRRPPRGSRRCLRARRAALPCRGAAARRRRRRRAPGRRRRSRRGCPDRARRRSPRRPRQRAARAAPRARRRRRPRSGTPRQP